MRTTAALLVALSTLLAGCFHADDDGDGGNGGGGAATVTSVAFTSVPSTGVAGSTAVVCWSVQGSGTIPHAAIHTDTTSHAGEGFAAYAGSIHYPDNATTATQVNLPATLCTGVALPAQANETLYLRAHAMVTPPGVVSPDERTIRTTEAGVDVATSIALTSVPATVAANGTAVVCWRVEGKGSVPHTAIHWDVESRNTTGATFQAYAKPAAYPGNASSAEPLGIPATFCTGIQAPLSGKMYVRAHVIDADGPPGKLSAREAVIDVVGKATAILFDPDFQSPRIEQANSTVLLCWRVEGEGVVPHTAIHTDNESHSGQTDFTAYDGPAYYPGNATAATPVTIPARFCTNVETPATGPATVYLRAHVIDVAGAPGMLTQEKSITVLV